MRMLSRSVTTSSLTSPSAFIKFMCINNVINVKSTATYNMITNRPMKEPTHFVRDTTETFVRRTRNVTMECSKKNMFCRSYPIWATARERAIKPFHPCPSLHVYIKEAQRYGRVRVFKSNNKRINPPAHGLSCALVHVPSGSIKTRFSTHCLVCDRIIIYITRPTPSTGGGVADADTCTQWINHGGVKYHESRPDIITLASQVWVASDRIGTKTEGVPGEGGASTVGKHTDVHLECPERLLCPEGIKQPLAGCGFSSVSPCTGSAFGVRLIMAVSHANFCTDQPP